MEIVDISIENFRGIRKLYRLKFGALSAIVGRNDAGKSIILHALDYFFNDKKLEDKDFYKGATTEEPTFIEVRFAGEKIDTLPCTLKDDSGCLCVRRECVDREKGKMDTYVRCNDFEDVQFKDLYNKTTSQLNACIKKMDISDAPEDLHLSINQIVEVGLSKAMSRSMCTNIVKNKKLKDTLEEIYPRYAMFMADTSLDTGSSNFQNQFRKIVTDAIESNNAICKDLKDSIDRTLKAEVAQITRYMENHYPDLKQLVPHTAYDWSKLISFDIEMEDNSPYKVPLRNKGTGIQRLLMVAYFQYLAEKVRDGAESYIFAIEEPETYLHPGAQRVLLKSLTTIAENAQIIITTHSPVFSSVINKESLILASKTGTESVYCQGDRISLESLCDELGVHADDNILMAKLLIFVEGTNDIRFWKIIKRKLTGVEFNEKDVLFIPGGGNELHNIAEMNLMQRLNRNFLVIVDKDSGACDYEEKCKKVNNLKRMVESKGGSLIVLRKREIENYYHPDVVKSMLVSKGIIVPELTFDPYEDIPVKLKSIIKENKINFKQKNNIDVFEAMTAEHWREVSKYQDLEHGECCELNTILQHIEEQILKSF